LVGFVKTVLAFQSDRSSRVGASPLGFDQIRWKEAPLAGLRMAAADMVEWCQDVGGEDLVRLDTQLKTAQIPTLTAMRDRNYRRALQILARNAIRNEHEWHVLNGFVANVEDRVLSSMERAQAARLLLEYRRERDAAK
jgi:hypothetical protein